MRRQVGGIILVLAAVAALAAGPAAAAAERILNFESYIRIHADASLTVTETITVLATGRTIKRGIVREFPTTYHTRDGRRVVTGFKVLKVTRDGRPEPYHLEAAPNGQKVYIGQKTVFLKPGVYTYRLTYRTDRQVGYFEDYDELYFNVTGNRWTFVIQKATAIIDLPPGAKVVQETAYTGPQGASGRDYQLRREPDGRLVYTTTRALGPGEGLTIAVAWPKGLVAEPSGLVKATRFLTDYSGAAGAAGGLLLVLLYYLVAWWRVGRDPKAGTIVPLFKPPRGISPAAARYVSRMGFDHTCFAAAVVDMAVKGYLKIKEGTKYFTLVKLGGDEKKLSPGERRAAEKLFGSSDQVVLKQANHRRIRGALERLQRSLQEEYEQIYFVTNRPWLFGGLGVTLLALAATVLTSYNVLEVLFISVWLSLWTVGCAFLVWRWHWARKGQKVFLTFFLLPFLGGWCAGVYTLTTLTSWPAVVLLALTCLANPLFFWLLKAPTLAGRKLLDELEGFKLYLGTAEADRLERLNPPERTPELFERYLPYALALGVEQKWSQQFAGMLQAAGQAGGEYAPAWYLGRSWTSLGAAGFAQGLSSSMSGAISSSSTAPGSSTGSGGGGFSGGGGGGGGGSGW